ncbi:MAG: hypothetical protein OT477_14755 [Chloroflexi bacterium]|nr:hypothetical protein [Chloroflexota bacterium]
MALPQIAILLTCLPLAAFGLAGWLFAITHLRATLASTAAHDAHYTTE